MSFYATRRGPKDHFWSPEMSKKRFSAISGRPKRLKSGFWPFLVTRNEQKEVFGHFGSPEMSKKWFAVISGHQKRAKRGLRPFRVTRNEQKEVFSHFGSPEMTKKRFAAISGHQTRLRRSSVSCRTMRTMCLGLAGLPDRGEHAAERVRVVSASALPRFVVLAQVLVQRVE